MKKVYLALFYLILTTTLQAQTTFRLELIAEGNFGTPNADIFVRNTTFAPATNSGGLYQAANASPTGFDVLQDYVIAGNKAVLAEKPVGAGRITIVNYPAMTEIHTFANAPQTLGVASANKVYACYAQGGVVSLVDLQNNTLTPVTEPNNEISTYCNHMQFAEGFMYLDQGAQLVKIDTVTNSVVAKFNPGVGSIKGIVYDNQGKLWVLGTSSINSIEVLNSDALGTAVDVGLSGKLLRFYNNKLYFWAAKSLYQYDLVTPPTLPLTAVYTSALPGTGGAFGPFGYGRSFDIDQSTGDFVIASANNYTAPGYYEVVDGTTFTVIESATMPGCAIPNKCVLKTFRAPNGPIPVPDQASLPAITDACGVTLTAPTADGGATTATTTDPLVYSTQGTFQVTWTFTNANGTIYQTQNITIEDDQDPVIPTLANVISSCSASPVAPTTTDNCAGTITGTTTTTFPITTMGTTIVTWTFDDGNGNVVTADQQIMVQDNVTPVTPPMTALNIACNDTVSKPVATDNCAGQVTGTTSDPLSYATPGTYTINWSFDDGNGNQVTVQQMVVVSCSSAGLDEVTAATISVYPVPASNELFIETSLIGETAVVCNAQGQKVLESDLKTGKTALDVSALVNGVYFLKTGNSSVRFVITK